MRTLIVSAFVYLQLTDQTPPVNLNINEVDSIRWIPLSFFNNSPINYFEYTNTQVSKISYYFKFNCLLYPTVKLPQTDNNNCEYLLWGLTFTLTMDLYQILFNKSLTILVYKYKYYPFINALMWMLKLFKS